MQIDERPIKDTMKAYKRGPSGWSLIYRLSVHGDYRTAVETIPTVGTLKHSSASHTDCRYNGSRKIVVPAVTDSRYNEADGTRVSRTDCRYNEAQAS
jgi:hypothetical protein